MFINLIQYYLLYKIHCLNKSFMVLKFTKEQFKGALQQATGKPFFKVQKALRAAGFDKFLHQSSISKDQFKKAINALRAQKVIYKQAGEIIRSVERKMASEATTGKKITITEIRKKMKEEEEKKEKMRKMMAEIYGRERAREAEKAGAGPTGPKHVTSALKPAGQKSAEEKPKPAPIDLPID